MNIPGQLARTTLGDVLGGLHRAGISGVLELVEGGGARVHRVFLSHGLVDGVETPLPEAQTPGLSGELRAGLEAVFRIEEAELRFRARRLAGLGPGRSRPLLPAEFLHGRPRARNARSGLALPSERAEAYRVLGLHGSASRADVRSAFRKLARAFHPDRYPRATPREREALLQRFARLSAAYHALDRE